LGQGKTFKVDVNYDKALDPMAGLPTPQECLERVQTVQARQKISFGPGSAEIDAASNGVMDALAKALQNCTAIKLEIGGHTDAQGSAQGNLALSQARAEAVLVALQGRQVDVSAMRAVGYGEGVPIADNGTEAGRETNRRIEFTLIGAAAGDVPGGSLAAMLGKAAQDPAAPDAAAAGAGATSATAPDAQSTAPEVETAPDGSPLAPKAPTLKPKTRPKT
jgi:OOP family OmpA-OmpF porin